MAEVFPEPVDLRALRMEGGRRLWELLRPFRAITSHGLIVVPEGFTTDLASVPRALWAGFSPADEYLEAAIVHDFLYSPGNQRLDRRQSDEVMLELMFNVGVSWPRREAVFRAVRAFGAASFRGKLR